MGIKVVKFGGTSLASAEQFRKVIDIIQADADRRYVVPSAPGKRHSEDDKVTDLLIHCHRMSDDENALRSLFDYICHRYNEIIAGLELKLDLSREYEEIYNRMASGASLDYCASRGEYLSGKVLSCALGYDFIDPADHIFFTMRGQFDPDATHESLSRCLEAHPHAVIPGFYGSYRDGRIKTFSRGGSDVTGSIVARAVQAEEYENWTDVSGFMMADPRLVSNPRTIPSMSYRELRELSYMGANVLHEDAIFPVRQARIPIHIRNTNRPQDAGTVIDDRAELQLDGQVTGIAGKKGFVALCIDKSMMNSELGFGRRVLTVLENHGISFEYMPTGIDSLTIVLNAASLRDHLDEILQQISEAVDPDRIQVYENLAMIAVVGHGTAGHVGIAAKLFGGLAKAGINVRIIDQGPSEMNITVGVDENDYARAVAAIYQAFVPNEEENHD